MLFSFVLIQKIKADEKIAKKFRVEAKIKKLAIVWKFEDFNDVILLIMEYLLSNPH